MDTERKMIGVDGGGTKTEFILFTEKGKILDRILLGACNPNTVGLETAMEILNSGIEQLLQQAPDSCGVFVGAAGLDSGDYTEQVQSYLRKQHPALQIRCENDIYNVMASGSDPENCIAVICGTGMAVYANKQGKVKRYGGRGYLLDKGGSGYHIGRDAVCAAMDAEDGKTEHNLLSHLVEEKIGGTVWENIEQIYGNNQSYTASFAPCVFEAYEHGDQTAEEILKKNAEKLAQLINLAANECGIEKNVVASGSIVVKKENFRTLLKERMKQGLELEVPEEPPVFGACVMCCRLCGAEAEEVKKNFNAEYSRCSRE